VQAILERIDGAAGPAKSAMEKCLGPCGGEGTGFEECLEENKITKKRI